MRLIRISAVVMAAVTALSLCGCGKKQASGSQLSLADNTVLDTLGTNRNVTKMYPEVEAWVVDAEGYDGDYKVPQFNVESESADAINAELLKKYGEIESLGEESGYTAVGYTFGDFKCVASVCIALNKAMGVKEYDVHNISLSNGEEATADEVVANFGISKNAYKTALKDALTNEFNIDYYSFKDSNLSLYDEYLEKTVSESNLKKAVPYVTTRGELCFVANLYTFSGEISMRNLVAVKSESAVVK